MEIKIEPNRLASLSKRMMEHQNRTKNLQHSLEREAGKMTSLLWQSEFPPPFTGQITGQNDMINQTSQRIVNTLEYQAAWLSYFAHKASGADGAPFSLKQAEAVLAKYDERFRKPEKSKGLDKEKLAKDAAGELSGVYDVERAATGVDPVTGEKLSGWSRVLSGGMVVLGVTPIGKGIKAFKVVRTADKVVGVAQEGRRVRRVVESTSPLKSSGLETRGYKPGSNERLMTKEAWKVMDRERRIAKNYSKPSILEKDYDVVKSNPKYYTSEGEINWPPNRGVLGNPEKMELAPGTVIDRFGYEGGTFVSPYGVPYESRALAPETYVKPYKVYVVKKPIEVQAGKIAPWFDEPGLGTQYEFSQSVKKLIDQNIIGRIGD